MQNLAKTTSTPRFNFKLFQNSALITFYFLYIFDLALFLFSTLRLLIYESSTIEELSDFLIFDFFRITLFVIIFNAILLYFLSRRFQVAYLIALTLNVLAIFFPLHSHDKFLFLNTFTNSIEVLALLINWEGFSVINKTFARWKRVLALAFLSAMLLIVYGFAGFKLLENNFDGSPDLPSIAGNTYANLFAASQVPFDETTLHPKNTLGKVFLTSITYSSWVILFPVVITIFEKRRPDQYEHIHETSDHRLSFQTLSVISQDSLTAFKIQPTIKQVNLPEGYVFVGETGRSWICLGDPAVFPNATMSQLMISFAKKSNQENKIPALFQVSALTVDAAKKLGWYSIRIGSEALIDTVLFDIKTPEYKKIRNSHTSFKKQDWQFEFVDTGYLNESHIQAVSYLRSVWTVSKSREQLGFSMNIWPLTERTPGYLVLVKHSDFGYVAGFSFLEFVHQNSKGLSLDLFYTNQHVKSPIADGVLTECILKFKNFGVRWISIGLAPNTTQNPDSSALQKLTTVITNRLTGYNSDALYSFKKKFANVWLDKYLIAPGIDNIPVIVQDISKLVNAKIEKNNPHVN